MRQHIDADLHRICTGPGRPGGLFSAAAIGDHSAALMGILSAGQQLTGLRPRPGVCQKDGVSDLD